MKSIKKELTGNKNGVDLPKKPLIQKEGKAYTTETITVTFPEVKIKVEYFLNFVADFI